ncbi:MAG: Gfo/Idh/MocA family oxidoreductase [Terriglobales bacterium]
MSTPEKTRVAVIGIGAFGRNHARVYAELQKQGEPVELAAVCDADPERAAELAMEFRTQAFTSLDQLILKGNIHAASVAVPTVHHLAVAQKLMEAGIDVLIEKPVATSLEEADALIRLARQRHRIAMVGHLERFNPAVRATLPLINHPMFFEVHRLSIFTPRALDVDVVLDLMIHDLDIVLSLVNSPVKEVRAVGLPILSPKVDIANVRVEFESGCVANFTASRVSTEKVRKVRFFQPHQYVSIDYAKQDVFAITVDAAVAADPAKAMAAAAADPGALPIPGLSLQRPEVTSEEPLRAELKEFLSAVREQRTPLVSLEEGRRALALALDITAAIADHHRRADLDRIALGK